MLEDGAQLNDPLCKFYIISLCEDYGGRKGEGVGVMKDKELKVEEIDQIHYNQMVSQEQSRDLGFGCAINQRT